MTFNYIGGTTFEKTDFSRTVETDFYNLKNKAIGARRYGYSLYMHKCTDPSGNVAYRGTYQTLLNGERYQSSKDSAFVATEAEAIALLEKTVTGAMKRYAKLALDPANKIEHRP